MRTLVTAALVTLATVGCGELDDQSLQQAEYCRMVEMYRQSGGELGWPDYERTYDEHCTTEKGATP